MLRRWASFLTYDTDWILGVFLQSLFKNSNVDIEQSQE